MTSGLKISPDIQAALRCPRCQGRLSRSGDEFACEVARCEWRYPIVDGIPVLINEDRSVFSISDFAKKKATTFHAQSAVERFLSRVIPELGTNFRAEGNFRRLADLLKEFSASPKVLVIGCGEVGRGMDSLTSNPAIQFVSTDVSFMPATQMICDSHDLPFQDEQFDGAIVQAVLEHVADPPRCVEELHRVMKRGALIYAETPFIQQVHGGPYDFTRYTHLGHRRLFRGFEEIGSGATAGSGTALAWSYQYFLLSFVRTTFARSAVKGIARLTSFWLKYFDYFLLDRPGSLDAASGYFFLGRKCSEVLPDRQLIALYRGAGSTLPVTN